MTIDLVGPKGYVHGWRWVGNPGQSPPPGISRVDRDIATGTQDWQRSIHQYDLDVASGRIGFSGGSKFATSYPGRETAEASLMEHIQRHVSPPPSRTPSAPRAGRTSPVKNPESAAGRRDALRRGLALPPASPGGLPGYPVTDAEHWDKARQAVGRVKDPARRAALAKLLRKTAPMFGRTQSLTESWAASNGRWPVEYDLAGRYAALGFAGTSTMDGMTDTGRQPGFPSVSASSKVAGPAPGYEPYTNPQNLDGDTDAAMHTHTHMHRHADGTEHSHEHSHTHDGVGVHSHSGTDEASGTHLDTQPAALRTPARGDTSTAGFQAGSSGIQVASRGGSYGAMSNRRGGIELSRRMNVTSPSDILVSRGSGGTAIIRHRRGGETIGELSRSADGTWTGTVTGGVQIQPHTQQRAALYELIGTWNRGTTTPYRPAEPLMPKPEQTPMMQQLGIPAIRLAMPDGDGDNDGGTGPAGLTPAGVSIYRKLMAKGVPAARALSFARNAQKRVKTAA